MVQNNSDLRRPIGIYILALLFILAPIGNIFISFAGSGVEGWYRPEVFSDLSAAIPFADWLWLAGIFIAGLSLLLRHKSAWVAGVFTLLVVLIMNTFRAFNVDENTLNPEFVRMQILISILVTFSVLIIAFYARYPYLDRRQQWIFPTAHRYDFPTSITVHIDGDVVGVTESISSAGVRIRMPKVVDALKHAKDLHVTFNEMDNFEKIKTEIVEFNGTTLRLRFKQFGWGRRGLLEAWLRSKKSATPHSVLA
ncbi:MAG: PilZ domain-containing protein [Bdellovibrionaceae bacterium]|nr:PilZ domain-containing protein [Pseudobdellovibrionaceae bacterium]